MEKEKIPAYRVIETFGLVCVAEFNFSEFRYKGISLGECLAETQNWLYLKEGKNECKLIWLSDDKDDYFFAPAEPFERSRPPMQMTSLTYLAIFIQA